MTAIQEQQVKSTEQLVFIGVPSVRRKPTVIDRDREASLAEYLSLNDLKQLETVQIHKIDGESKADTALPAQFEIVEEAAQQGLSQEAPTKLNLSCLGKPLKVNKPYATYKYQREQPWHRIAAVKCAMGESRKQIAEELGVTMASVTNATSQPIAKEIMGELMMNIAAPSVEKIYLKALPSLAESLIAIAQDPDVAPKDRIKAIEVAQNRVMGMPTQPIADSRSKSPRDMTDDELLETIMKERQIIPANLPN